MANVTITPTLLTRPGDTNIYAVGDGIASSTTVATVQQLTNFSASASGTAFLVGFQIVTSQKACQAGIRVHFYSGTQTAVQDNAVFTLLTANQTLYQGFIDLPAFNTEDTTSTVAVTLDKGLSFPITADASKIVYFEYELKTGAFTPDNAQTFRATAWVVQ